MLNGLLYNNKIKLSLSNIRINHRNYFFLLTKNSLILRHVLTFSKTNLINNNSNSNNFSYFVALIKTVCLWKKINKIFFFKKKIHNVFIKRYEMKKSKIVNRINFPYLNSVKTYKAKYYFIGLGYKMYVWSKTLFIWVGLTHYSLIPLPRNVHVFAKKKRIYLLSKDETQFNKVFRAIRDAKKRDIYKGKGILEVKSYKNFIKMKTGKKKQY